MVVVVGGVVYVTILDDLVAETKERGGGGSVNFAKLSTGFLYFTSE